MVRGTCGNRTHVQNVLSSGLTARPAGPPSSSKPYLLLSSQHLRSPSFSGQGMAIIASPAIRRLSWFFNLSISGLPGHHNAPSSKVAETPEVWQQTISPTAALMRESREQKFQHELELLSVIHMGSTTFITTYCWPGSVGCMLKIWMNRPNFGWRLSMFRETGTRRTPYSECSVLPWPTLLWGLGPLFKRFGLARRHYGAAVGLLGFHWRCLHRLPVLSSH